ncbi:YHR127W-like protein [Saccharomyces cerevisiae x Saccharomyces kudriavzevii VIN7]|uniref:YHR127W-like protein n=1 Tax=Saccharomyces cerevisiae x Saccharomyces kudriavzevii (strain VIN7) TaxID=1095631 RepID=H0GVW3_SACCK|nr:YHR127W-like protein [Saccharomyces cerevisiae x Saccharomyces kudriavzevii VIN7]
MARNRINSKKNIQGKRLIDRVVPMDKIKKADTFKRAPVKNAKEGFSVVNGKLVSSNDIGVLLREAQGAVDKRNNVLQGNKRNRVRTNKNSNSGHSVNVSDSNDLSNARGRAGREPFSNKRGQKIKNTNNSDYSRVFSTSNGRKQRQQFGGEMQGGSQLVISTNSDASNKLLMLFNLTLGVNNENLKNVLEDISQVQIAQIRVRDLPSGSATAKVRLAYPTTQSLEKVRKLFHGALVDGRRIQVVIASDESSNLSY